MACSGPIKIQKCSPGSSFSRTMSQCELHLASRAFLGLTARPVAKVQYDILSIAWSGELPFYLLVSYSTPLVV